MTEWRNAMTLENDAKVRREIHDYWAERLKREAEEAQEASRLRILTARDPWFIRLIDWLAK